MKYIKLNLGGEERAFNFGLGFLSEAMDEFNMSVDDIQDLISKNIIKATALLMYCSAKFNVLKKGEKPSFNMFDVYDWIEDAGGMNSEPITEFWEAFNKSFTKDVPKEEVQELAQDEGQGNEPKKKG